MPLLNGTSEAQQLRKEAGLSQIQLAQKLGLQYPTFVSQVENGFGRIPTEGLKAWALALGLAPAAFTRHLLKYYDPEIHRLLFEDKKNSLNPGTPAPVFKTGALSHSAMRLSIVDEPNA